MTAAENALALAKKHLMTALDEQKHGLNEQATANATIASVMFQSAQTALLAELVKEARK